MDELKSEKPVFRKEIKIQPIIHLEIQPVITTEIQPVINQKIQIVVHKQIQPIIDQEIQPVITKEIQPIIHRKIQPVIFMENQTNNIKEVIQQLEQSNKQNYENIFEEHTTQRKENPSIKKEVKNIDNIKVVPYLMTEEKHITQKVVVPKTETIKKTVEIIEFIPYIQYKNGTVLPYEKKNNKTSSEINETIIAVNFISLKGNINYPMACKNTDIFSKIEEKLYNEFPQLKSQNIYFIANGNVVDKSSTFEQNKIKNGSSILIEEIKK